MWTSMFLKEAGVTERPFGTIHLVIYSFSDVAYWSDRDM